MKQDRKKKQKLKAKKAKISEEPAKRAPVFCLADVATTPISWLWPGRIPSKLCTLAGNPGQGKSQITIDLAARITTGKKWPDGKKNKCKGSVLFINCEDEPGDTLKPRLIAAGGDPKKFFVLDFIYDPKGNRVSWTFEKGIAEIEAICELHKDLRMIVIDPVTAYMGGKDGHSASDVRGALRPIMDLANKRNITVLLVSHLNKSSGAEAMNRVNGSGAYVAAARVAFIVGSNKDEVNNYYLTVLKTNLSQDKTACEYSIEPARIVGDSKISIETSRIEWGKCDIPLNADELLAAPSKSSNESQRSVAESFLRHTLSDGPVLKKDLEQLAEFEEISMSTLTRAKNNIGVFSRKKNGDKGPWEWGLPEHKASKDANKSNK